MFRVVPRIVLGKVGAPAHRLQSRQKPSNGCSGEQLRSADVRSKMLVAEAAGIRASEGRGTHHSATDHGFEQDSAAVVEMKVEYVEF